MFAQLWHTGCSSHIAMTGGANPVSACVDSRYWMNPNHLVSIPGGWVQPSPQRTVSVEEIAVIGQDYGETAKRAMDAGFDGVDLHAANGYLVDQFLQDGSNRRGDAYGGSLENRTRLLSEIVHVLSPVWGADRVAVRIRPYGTWNGSLRIEGRPARSQRRPGENIDRLAAFLNPLCDLLVSLSSQEDWRS